MATGAALALGTVGVFGGSTVARNQVRKKKSGEKTKARNRAKAQQEQQDKQDMAEKLEIANISVKKQKEKARKRTIFAGAGNAATTKSPTLGTRSIFG